MIDLPGTVFTAANDISEPLPQQERFPLLDCTYVTPTFFVRFVILLD